jgi:broad specificity phosphatase PhoE
VTDKSSESTSTGWSQASGRPTTLILLRHGVTSATLRKVFSGSGGTDPELIDQGHEQAERAAAWIAGNGPVDAIVASPMRRTQQTAAAVGRTLGLEVEIEHGLREASFGDWEGFTFGEIADRWPDQMQAWLASTAVAPPQGEAFDEVDARVGQALDSLLERYRGQTLVAVSHVTPIKLAVTRALGAPITSIYSMELSPASITTITWWPDANASLRAFNIVP